MDKVGISHETIYRHLYTNKVAGGSLYQPLRCQKKRKKRYASGHDRRGQIVGRRPISERPAHIEARSQIGHWEGDTVIGAHHKQAIVTLVERKSGYALIAKVSNKTSDLVAGDVSPYFRPCRPRTWGKCWTHYRWPLFGRYMGYGCWARCPRGICRWYDCVNP